MLPYVRDKNIWMSSDTLEVGSNKTVAWLLNGHMNLLPKKLLLKSLDAAIRECSESKRMLEENLAIINKYSPGEFNFTIVTKL